MTESDWLTTRTRPAAMLDHVRGKLPGRKELLLACAACRLVWERIAHPPLRAAVEATERFADGLIPADDLTPIVLGARGATGWRTADGVWVPPAYEPDRDPAAAARMAAECASLYSGDDAKSTVSWVLYSETLAAPGGRAGGAAKVCDLIREVVGNPFRPWKVVPAFLGGGLVRPDGATVRVSDAARRIAEGVHAAQAFDRLPVLADALEEAGVTDPGLLAHLRAGGGHVRGCWALDVVLGNG